MKLTIDLEKCLGCGTCASICPEVFELNAEGKAQIKTGVKLDDFIDSITEAAAACPTQAIISE